MQGRSLSLTCPSAESMWHAYTYNGIIMIFAFITIIVIYACSEDITAVKTLPLPHNAIAGEHCRPSRPVHAASVRGVHGCCIPPGDWITTPPEELGVQTSGHARSLMS